MSFVSLKLLLLNNILLYFLFPRYIMFHVLCIQRRVFFLLYSKREMSWDALIRDIIQFAFKIRRSEIMISRFHHTKYYKLIVQLQLYLSI